MTAAVETDQGAQAPTEPRVFNKVRTGPKRSLVLTWQICLVGVIFAAGVPAIAWLEQVILLIVVALVAVIAVAALFWWHRDRRDEDVA